MILIFEFFSFVFSLKPIYLVSGFGDFPIYYQIDYPTLYPECPPEIYHQKVKISDPQFFSAYPDCVAKLLRVQFNNTTKKVEQLPGIRTYNLPFNDISPYFDTFGTIIDKIKDLGYQENLNIFGVGYNYFLHPVTSYSIYNELKSKIEQDYKQTREKSIFISFDQGTSFTSIFLSNFSQPEWVTKYIDSVIFIAPTFAGFSSIPKSIIQAIQPFKTNDELRKSLIRMPGLHIRIPNYAIFEISKTPKSKFLKEIGNFDAESEIIFKAEAEKYLKVPVPEPPIPSLLIYNDRPAKTVFSFNFHPKDDEFKSSTVSRYLCTKWKTIQCNDLKDRTNHSEIPKTIKTANFITNYLKDRNETPQKKHLLDSVPSVDIKQTTDKYASYEYINSHMVSPLQFTVEAPQAVNARPITNAFDDDNNTFYMSATPNSASYNTTINISFTETVSLEAIIFDSAYTTQNERRTYHGFPTLIYVYTSTGDQPFSLNTIFKGNPISPYIRYQFVLPQVVKCDKLKLELASITAQAISGSGNNLLMTNLYFVQYFDFNYYGCAPVIQESSFYASYGYVNKRKVPKSDFTFSGTEGQNDYPISNLFDDDDTTLYIPNIENSETFNNSISITFKKTYKLEAFLLSTSLNINGRSLQGFPKVVTVYTSTGNQQLSFKATFKANPFNAWKKAQYVFNEPILCDNLKLEFYDLYGDSKNPVIAGLLFVEEQETFPITGITGKYSNDGYVRYNAIHPSEFTYSGSEGNVQFPLYNIFDYDPQTYYLSEVLNNDTFYSPITIHFLKTVDLEAFLIDTTYATVVPYERIFIGAPIVLYLYASLGNEPLQLKAMFKGMPAFPMMRIQFVLPESIKCDTIRIDFVEILNQRNKGRTKQLSISELLLIKKMEFEPTLFTGVTNKFDNNDYIMNHRIDPMNFTYDAPEGEINYPIENAFDDNPKTYYVSNIVNANYTYTTMNIDFHEAVDLEALIIDPFYSTSGTSRTFQGFPLSIIVSKSINDEDFTLNNVFIGDPVYPWDRIQFVFPSVFRCDKLKLEFIEVTNENVFVKRKSLTIGQLYFIRSELPAPTRSPQPIPIDDVCEIGKTHCNYEGNEQNKVVIIIKSNFSSIASDDDGGALHIINAGISCDTMIISGCKSKQGGGGGLFIDNNIDMENMINIRKVNFSNCAANYGGAIFVHSSSTSGKVEIDSCFFYSCQLITNSKSSVYNSLTGGSALFMSSRNSLIADCSFSKNTGESQFKIYNNFDSSVKNTRNLLGFQPKTINMINFCRFEVERNSKCSLYYLGGNDGVGCYVKNSVFVGTLSYSNYHISGQSLSEKSPKLVIELCKFSHDQRRSFNNDGDNDYMSVIFQKQVFNYNEDEKSDDDDESSFNYTIIIIAAVVIVIIVIVMFVIKKSVEIAHLGNAAVSATNAQKS